MTRKEFLKEFGYGSDNYNRVRDSQEVEIVSAYGRTYPQGEDFTASSEIRDQVAAKLRKIVAEC